MAERSRRTFSSALLAIAVSIALLAGQATGITGLRPLVALVNTVIGIGGSSDPLSERLPAKLNNTVVPPGDAYIGSEYPATLNLDYSLRVGMPVLRQHLVTTSGKVLVAGYSLGALLTEQLERDLAGSSTPPSSLDVSFLQIGTPFVPNGGVFARFPGLSIPGVVSAMGPAQTTRYDTTYVVNEYDPYGDFPAYFNPLALLNTVLGHQYAHLDTSYDPMDPLAADNHVKVVTHDGVTDTYILVPNPRLPLLGPLRDIAQRLGLTPVTERLLGAVEPLLRVIIDMAYTDRLNLNPEVRQPFSLFTPPHKILQALNAVPGAVHEGVQNLLGIPRAPVTPIKETAVEASPEDDLESAPALTRKRGGTAVATLRDSTRSAAGEDRPAPRTDRKPDRPRKSGQDRRERGAEAA